MSFFFFQAEDGIRDVAVTGVQTCALPISNPAQLYRLGDNNNCCVMDGTQQNGGSFVLYSYQLYEDLRDHTPEFTELAAFESHLRSEEHTSELQSRLHLVCRLLLVKKKNYKYIFHI